MSSTFPRNLHGLRLAGYHSTRISLKNNQPKHNTVYFGALVIIRPKKCTYVVSLGKAHFYISRLCDTDFGMDLAQRILDADSLKRKYSKHFFGKRNQSVTAYRSESRVEYESGESFHFIKSGTIAPKTWGPVVLFGNSAQFQLPIKPAKLASFVRNIDKELTQPSKVDLPRLERIHETKTIATLDAELGRAIKNKKPIASVQEMTLSGKDLIVAEDFGYSLHIQGKKNSTKSVATLTIEGLADFAAENKIDLEKELHRISIHIETENEKEIIRKPHFFLDYVNADDYCLSDGKWHKFNSSYIDYLRTYVSQIAPVYDAKHDISEVKLQTHLSSQKKNNVDTYAEDYFNKERESEGYVNADKTIKQVGTKYKIEPFDLYKDNCMHFVKLGSPQKISYAIDQAINTRKAHAHGLIQILVRQKKGHAKKDLSMVRPYAQNRHFVASRHQLDHFHDETGQLDKCVSRLQIRTNCKNQLSALDTGKTSHNNRTRYAPWQTAPMTP